MGSGSSGAPRESVDPSPACQVGGRARWGAQPRGDARDGVGVGGERGGGARVGNARRGWRGLEDGAETRLVLWGVARGHASGEAQEEAGRGGRGLAARTRRRMKLECFCSSRALVRARTRLGLPCAQQRHGSAPARAGPCGEGPRVGQAHRSALGVCSYERARARDVARHAGCPGGRRKRRRGKRRANRPSSAGQAALERFLNGEKQQGAAAKGKTRGAEAEGLAEGGVYPRREDLLEPAEGDPLPSTPQLGDPTRAEGVLRRLVEIRVQSRLFLLLRCLTVRNEDIFTENMISAPDQLILE